MSAAFLLLLATTPSPAEPTARLEAKPTAGADARRDRGDGVLTPPPPLCDDLSACDLTKPFRFRGRATF